MLWILAFAAAMYLVLVFGVWALQGTMVYKPTRKVFTDPKRAHDLDFEDLELTTQDGVRIRAWYTPAENPRAVLLFCHGNGGNLAHRAGVVHDFHSLGLSSLLFDYRGYGGSQGRPSEQGTYLDAQAAWDFLVQQRGVPPGRIIIIGRSLGGPIAAHTAAHNAPAGLSLEATFTSAVDLGRRLFPLVPVGLVLRYRYETARHLRDVACPVMVSHGTRDGVVPFSHGKRLLELAPEPRRFVQLHGVHLQAHTDGTRGYLDALSEFVDDCVGDGRAQIGEAESDRARL